MAAAMNEAALQNVVRKLTDPAASECWMGQAAKQCAADRSPRLESNRGPLSRRITANSNVCTIPTAPAALSERRKALDAIKDSVELLHTPQYPGFLALCFEPVCAQLTATQPQFERDSELQLLRHAALEVLSRLPANEAFKQYSSKLCDVCLSVRVTLRPVYIDAYSPDGHIVSSVHTAAAGLLAAATGRITADAVFTLLPRASETRADRPPWPPPPPNHPRSSAPTTRRTPSSASRSSSTSTSHSGPPSSPSSWPLSSLSAPRSRGSPSRLRPRLRGRARRRRATGRRRRAASRCWRSCR